MTYSMQDKKGTWYIVISYYDRYGKRSFKWISTGIKAPHNKRTAKAKCEELFEKFKKEYEEGLYQKRRVERRRADIDVNMLRNELFSKSVSRYIESKKNSLSPSVYKDYSETCLKRIKEFFDKQDLRLIDIISDDIIDFFDYLRAKGLKETTLLHFAYIIRPCLTEAYKNRVIPENPYDFVPVIKKNRPLISYYTKDEMNKFLDCIRGNKYELVFRLAAMYGLRRSEILGIKWNAIDMENNTISIRHKVINSGNRTIFTDTLKTKSSYRTLPLLPVIKTLLLEQKDRIRLYQKAFKSNYCNDYQDYVFTNEYGKVYHSDTVSQAFRNVLKAHNLKHIRFHDLRHSCASLLLRHGISMKQIQEWLGHSNFATTADIYSHLDYSSKVDAANTMAQILGEETVEYSNPDPQPKQDNDMEM